MPSSRRSAPALLLLLPLALASCVGEPEWSPLDGPWDPGHPRAAEFLRTPEPGSPVDTEMAAAGEGWYRTRGCLACHTVDGRDVVGPSLLGVTERREYSWFRGMVMNPDSMFRVDAEAQELLRRYRVPMPNQGVDELRTRAMWEYLRRVDAR